MEKEKYIILANRKETNKNNNKRGKEMKNKELINIITNEEGKQCVSARELHHFLEVGQDFTSWIKRMINYGFELNEDFMVTKISERKTVKHEYIITLDMAKELSMIQRTEKGKQARKYFIECEKKLKDKDSTKEIKALKAQIMELEAKVISLENIIDSHKDTIDYLEENNKALEEYNEELKVYTNDLTLKNEILKKENKITTERLLKDLETMLLNKLESREEFQEEIKDDIITKVDVRTKKIVLFLKGKKRNTIVKQYDSIVEASKELGLASNTITRYCSGNHKTCLERNGERLYMTTLEDFNEVYR